MPLIKSLMIVKMPTGLERRVEELRTSTERKYKKDAESQTRTEMKNTPGEINSRLVDAEECISNLEDRLWRAPKWNSKKKKEF